MILLAVEGSPAWFAFDLAFWQGVVFVLLFLGLAFYAGPPIAAAMRRRQTLIVESLRQAQEAAEEIRQIREQQTREREKSRQMAEALLTRAGADAKRIHAEILVRAKEDAESFQRRVDRDIRLATQRAAQELWQVTTALSTHAAEELLRHELDPQDHRRLIDESLAEISQSVGGAA